MPNQGKPEPGDVADLQCDVGPTSPGQSCQSWRIPPPAIRPLQPDTHKFAAIIADLSPLWNAEFAVVARLCRSPEIAVLPRASGNLASAAWARIAKSLSPLPMGADARQTRNPTTPFRLASSPIARDSVLKSCGERTRLTAGNRRVLESFQRPTSSLRDDHPADV